MRRYWTCRRCSYRQERRTNSRTCINCGSVSRRETRKPAHAWPLEQGKETFAQLNATVHGVDTDVCAICQSPPKAAPLQRDHAHQDGGYPRGLLCPMCNKRLGEVERGNDGEAWLEAALRYVRAAAAEHFTDEAVA